MKKKQSDEQNVISMPVVKSRNVWQNGQRLFPEHQRPDWDTYFLDLAKAVSARADCRRAQHGCVIVKHRRVVATGYNAAPSGGPSCLAGECPRGLLSYDEVRSLAGDYDNCISIHAEANALLHATWTECYGATLYVTGPQCGTCRKLSMGAGIARVVWPTGEELFK